MSEFETRFGRKPQVAVFAPARVNLIGEHVDYCGGLVLPMAINQGTRVVAAGRKDSRINVYSARFQERVSFDLAQLDEIAADCPSGHWRDFVIGCLKLHNGILSMGLDIFIDQNISGGGLSSSASFSVAFSRLLRWASGNPVTGADELTHIALACQRVEHEYVGLNCGIMDQFSVALGDIIALDCQAQTWEQLEPPSRLNLIVMDTGVPRTLAASAYNERVAELKQVAGILFESDNISQLATLPFEELAALEAWLGNSQLQRRLRHVVTEQSRTEQAVQALKQEDLFRLGQLMYQSHLSLQRDYQVSCDELDLAVELLGGLAEVRGARMTGAGFGGCAIALADQTLDEAMLDSVKSTYEQQSGRKANVFVAQSNQGVSLTQLA